MRINSIRVKNFRCFEELTIILNKNYTVLIGVNGTGKSTILDAISVGLGSYIAGFENLSSNGINKNDSSYKMYQLGSAVNREHQFPVEVEMDAQLENINIEWKRSLNSEKGKTTVAGARDIMQYVGKLQEKVRSGDKETILPVIAYYGTGRLWMQKKEKKVTNKQVASSRLNGYIDCLDAASNEKLMLNWFEDMTYIELQHKKNVPELEVVKDVMAKCYRSINPDICDLEFIFNVKSHELEIVSKKCNGEIENLPVRLLSDGIKSTLSMVADIAYRMAVLNPQLLQDISSQTSGVILIDEIDMHLHPSWQKKIIHDLCMIFPKVQFVFTTHAPSILANVKKENVLVLDNYHVYEPSNTTYGRDITAILREIMQVEVRPAEVVEKINSFYYHLDHGELEAAKKNLSELNGILGDNDADVVKAKVSLDLEEM